MHGVAGGQSLVEKHFSVKGLRAPLIGVQPLVPAAILSIGELQVGAQRQGFLRIGVLPLAKATDAEIRFRLADLTALADLPRLFKNLAKSDKGEMERFAIFGPENDQPLLRAARATLDGEADLELSDVNLPDGTHLEAARLVIDGKHAGEIRSGESRHLLFPRTPSNPVSQ